MDNVQKARDFPEMQDALGKLMRQVLFTSICVCFPLDDDSSQARIVEILTKALEQLADGFPWLAGQATFDEKTGCPTIIAGDSKCPLIVKDLTDDATFPSMDALRTARFPFSMLDGAVLTPVPHIPSSWKDPPVPVFILQVNFINGGLILSFMGEHSMMDGAGLGYIMNMFSRACHGGPFTTEELLHGNRARTNIIPLLDVSTFKLGPELEPHFILDPAKAPFRGRDMTTKSTFAYFNFSKTSLHKLKSLAGTSASMSDQPTVPFTTTNDAVSAFIWKCTTRVRAHNMLPDARTMFVRAVDARACLDLPPTHLGNLTHQTYNSFPVSLADSIPLGTLASSLRSGLSRVDLAHGIRSVATLIETTEDLTKVSYGADFNILSDIWFSSWARLDCFNLDFNLGLGLPEAVRKPRIEISEGLMYLMPMDRERGIDAAICLREEDMEKLRTDEEWCQFAEWIG